MAILGKTSGFEMTDTGQAAKFETVASLKKPTLRRRLE